MTERKPTGVSFESWIDKQVREAEQRGEFKDLPGAGKPLPGLNKPYDELWWVKQKVRDEQASEDSLLPTPLKLRKEIDRLPGTVRELSSERAVRETVRDLNERILAWLRMPTGPQIVLRLVDDDRIVADWQAARATTAAGVDDADTSPNSDLDSGSAAAETRVRQRGKWFRRRR